jgi:magnesium transporter
MSPAQVQPKIEEAIRTRNFGIVRSLLSEWEPADLAELIQELEPEDRGVLFRLLPRALAADSFEYLPPEFQEDLLKALGREQVAAILNDMSPDDRTALLEELPASATRQLLTLLTPEERQVAKTLLGYPEDSIGRLMTPDYLAVRPEWAIERALEHIRRYGHDTETLNVIYVVDERGKLIDDLRIRQLLLAPPQDTIADIMDGHFVALSAMDDQETAIQEFSEYDRVALPVIDSEGMLIGIVTIDDVLDVAEEEATEDIQKIGGMEALDEPYLQTGYVEMVRKRVGWLIVLFFGQMLTATALDFFRAEIASALILVLFLPLIIASGGNSGAQAATMVIRAMALGEVTMRHWWSVMRREIVSGFALGIVVGAVGFLGVWGIALYRPEAYGEYWVLIGLTVGASLLGVVLWGTLIGSMLPFLMRMVGADPAASSTPFVATVVDVTGLLMYFSIAAAVLRGTLL